MKLRKIIREYFTFTKGERTGLVVLVIIVCFLLIANRIFFYFEEPTIADVQAFEEMLAKVKAAEKAQGAGALKLFAFDPNTIDSVSLSDLNLPTYVKRNILSYRTHGGKFRKAADLRKIYGMNDSIFTAVESFVEIETVDQPVPRKSYPAVTKAQSQVEEASLAPLQDFNAKEKVSLQIEINTADASEFERLQGIGPVLSKRIVSYRNLLGGFVSPDQLYEVYGLKPEVVQQNLNNFRVDGVEVRKLDLNFASIDELSRHPYINYKEARRIIDLRSKNGYISDKNILLTDSIIGIEKFRKLVFYLK